MKSKIHILARILIHFYEEQQFRAWKTIIFKVILVSRCTIDLGGGPVEEKTQNSAGDIQAILWNHVKQSSWWTTTIVTDILTGRINHRGRRENVIILQKNGQNLCFQRADLRKYPYIWRKVPKIRTVSLRKNLFSKT